MSKQHIRVVATEIVTRRVELQMTKREFDILSDLEKDLLILQYENEFGGSSKGYERHYDAVEIIKY